MTASKLFGTAALLLAIGFAGTATARELQQSGSDESRGYLGLALMTVDNHGEGQHANGVLVQTVMEGSPAEAAGILADDLLVSINGVSVSDFKSLHESMESTHPDQTVSVTLDRDGAEQTISVTLGEAPSEHDSRWGVVVDENRPYFGILIEELNPQLADYFEVEGGLLVTEVIQDAPADKAGLRAGDIVVAVEDQPVDDRGSLHKAMTDIEPGDEVAVRIERRGKPSTVFVEVGSHGEHNVTIDLRGLHELVEVDSEGNVEIVVPEGQHGVTIHRHEEGGLHEVREDKD